MNKRIADFPLLAVPENGRRLVYLDNGATTQRPAQVMAAVETYYRENNANPHRGVYELAVRATEAHETARHTVASFLHVRDEEIVFTQNATEALNLVAYSYGLANVGPGDEIVISVAEHHSNLVPWQRVARAKGARLVYLYPDASGRITAEEMERKITSKTKIVGIAHVSNVLGLAVDVDAVVEHAHAVGAKVVLDCAQSIPHMPVDLAALQVDFAAFSGHKLYAPMGIGILWGRYELLDAMEPFLSGGDMIAYVHEQKASWAEVPRKFEAGTRNVGGEVGLAAAIDYMRSVGWEEILSTEHDLVARALDGLRAMPFVTVYGDPSPDGRYGVISFNVEDVHPHDVATILDSDGIAIRAGHHCAQPLMEYLGIGSCCRASFALYNTEEDVDILLEALKNVRSLMGFGS